MSDCKHYHVKRRGYQLVEDQGRFEEGRFVGDGADSETFTETFGDVGKVTYTCIACGKAIRFKPVVFQVIVGNIGSVYYGDDQREAGRTFNHYLTVPGRTAGERVFMPQNGEITQEACNMAGPRVEE